MVVDQNHPSGFGNYDSSAETNLNHSLAHHTASRQQVDLERFVTPELSLKQVTEIKAAFDLFDLNGTGLIAPQDVESCLLSLGLEPRNSLLFIMHAQLNELVKSGRLMTFEQFLNILAVRFPQNVTLKDAMQVFRFFDVECAGFITLDKLREVCREIGEPLTEQEMEEMIKRADSDGDGLVSPEDFYGILTRSSNAHF